MGPHISQYGLRLGLPSYQVASSCIQPFGHNRQGPKNGGFVPRFCLGERGELGPMQHNVAWVEAYPHTKTHIEPSSHMATIDMGRNLGVLPIFLRRAGCSSNSILLGSKPTFLPSGILIHPAIWPQQIWAENWGLCPIGEGELGPNLTQCGRA